ncbi:4Fe-4S single cluster domain-containing protein [Acaryochloris marina NIES-2412]|uniref:4Fe-4S single cluster domain-containing protein n=1 Tax=Acaryochloris marina TaxID=155978 RepID=UPI00405A2EEA
MMETTQKIDPLLSLIAVPPGYLNVMGYWDASEENGPGCRAVVWLQGCHRRCSDCENPQFWSFEINELISIERMFQIIVRNPKNEGVTFVGGEPFWQAPALALLAERLKSEGLNTMAYTGFTLERLLAPYAPAGSQALLEQLDLVVDFSLYKAHLGCFL